jgi:hypothetical protein
MKNLMIMIILNFGHVMIKFELYALGLEMQTFSQYSNSLSHTQKSLFEIKDIVVVVVCCYS